MKLINSHNETLLFLNNGNLINHSSINDQLIRKLINLGIYEKGFSTHSLRHTYATRCIESGMQAIILSKLLGHSDIRVTLNTYVKVFNQYQTKIAKEVENCYKDINLLQNKKESNTYDNDYNYFETKGAKIIPFPKIAINDYYK